MKKWEYKEIKFEGKYRLFKKPHLLFTEDYMKTLNDEGRKGWEIVQFLQHRNSSNYEQDMTVILKREIPGTERSFF